MIYGIILGLITTLLTAILLVLYFIYITLVRTAAIVELWWEHSYKERK